MPTNDDTGTKNARFLFRPDEDANQERQAEPEGRARFPAPAPTKKCSPGVTRTKSMFPIFVNKLAEGDDLGDDWNDPEEQIHALARWYALDAARAGYQRSGRGAAIVPWPPESDLHVSFLPESACAPLGSDVMERVASYDPRAQFVLVFLLAGGDVDVYTYTVPAAGGVPAPGKVDRTAPAKPRAALRDEAGARRFGRRGTIH